MHTTRKLVCVHFIGNGRINGSLCLWINIFIPFSFLLLKWKLYIKIVLSQTVRNIADDKAMEIILSNLRGRIFFPRFLLQSFIWNLICIVCVYCVYFKWNSRFLVQITFIRITFYKCFKNIIFRKPIFRYSAYGILFCYAFAKRYLFFYIQFFFCYWHWTKMVWCIYLSVWWWIHLTIFSFFFATHFNWVDFNFVNSTQWNTIPFYDVISLFFFFKSNKILYQVLLTAN